MADEEQISEQEAIQGIYNFVAAEMKAGTSKSEITAKLEEQGIDRSEAEQITNEIYTAIATMVQSEQYTSSALIPGLVGGLLAALAGGGVWAGIAVSTDYELGMIAWGIGGLCGLGVVWLAKGRKGAPLQGVAVLTSVLGIVIGKYLTFYYFLKQVFLEEYGEESVSEMSLLSMDVIQFFVDSAPEMLSGYDALWVLLAVVTAWQIPKSSGITIDVPIEQGPITPG